MLPQRYTIVLADGESGVIRRFTIPVRPVLTVVACLFALPVLIGLGARWSAWAEIAQLRVTRNALELENANYRAATGELTTQIESLQSVVSNLSTRSTLDAATAKAVDKLPAVVRSRAMGGANVSAAGSLLSSALTTPEDTFGVLRDLLVGLESKLQLVRHGVEKKEALVAATPSIWPAHGWMSAGFGNRVDPFTGAREMHAGLDISTDRGQPVYATASGDVSTASYSGAYGNMVLIDHGFGLSTRYAHLSGYAVRAGASVRRGDIVGYVGATGRATGVHLHYEVLANGSAINPLQFLQSKPIGR